MLGNDDQRQKDEYDTPWKEILVAYFKDFMAFFLPEAYDEIDWRRGYEFLDQELTRITREADIGDRRVDKLVKVWRRDGDDAMVLIHVEIQGDREANFSERMYGYQYRAYDLRKRPVVSLAILADEEGGWRPSAYGRALWGTEIHFKFSMVKLLDFLENQAELENSSNPFAVVTMAHLQAKKTRNLTEDRYRAKWRLSRSLYQRGFSRQQIVDLIRFIDWVLHLPKEADQRFWKELVKYEEDQKMPYISSFERFAEERGEKRGEERGEKRGEKRGEERGEKRGEERGEKKGEAKIIIRLLSRRFGELSAWVHERVNAADLETLEQWGDRILDARALEEVFGQNPMH